MKVCKFELSFPKFEVYILSFCSGCESQSGYCLFYLTIPTRVVKDISEPGIYCRWLSTEPYNATICTVFTMRKCEKSLVDFCHLAVRIIVHKTRVLGNFLGW